MDCYVFCLWHANFVPLFGTPYLTFLMQENAVVLVSRLQLDSMKSSNSNEIFYKKCHDSHVTDVLIPSFFLMGSLL